jgi:hypothetical protein
VNFVCSDWGESIAQGESKQASLIRCLETHIDILLPA